MATAIGALHASLSASSAAFERDMGRAAKALGITKREFESLKSAATISGVAIAAAAAGLAAIVKSTANAGDQIAKMSRKLGIGAEDLSALGHAADLANVPMETLQTGLRILAGHMLDASKGSKEAQNLFADLGVEFKNADGSLRPLNSVFLEASKGLAGMADSTKVAALSQDAFGRSGLELVPLFKDLVGGIGGAKEEARKLGKIWTTEGVLSAEAFNDNLRRLGAGLEGVKLTIGNALIPVLDELASRLVTFVQTDQFRGWVAFIAAEIRSKAVPTLIGFARAFVAFENVVRSVTIGLMAFANVILATNLAVRQGGLWIRNFLGMSSEEAAAKVAELTNAIAENKARMESLADDVVASGTALDALERSLAKVGQAAQAAGQKVAGAGTATKALKDEFAFAIPQALSMSDALRGIGEEGLHLKAALEPASATMLGLSRELERNNLRAQVLGKSFNRLEADLATNRQAFEALVSQGVGPLDENLLKLAGTIQGLEAAKLGTFWQQQLQAIKDSAAATWSSISLSFSSALAGMIQGTTTFRDFLSSAFNTVLQTFIQLGVQMIANWAMANLFQQAQSEAGLAVHTATETAKTAITGAQEFARLGISLATNKIMLAGVIATLAGIAAVGEAAMAVMEAVVVATAAILSAIGSALAISIVGAPLAPEFFLAAAEVTLVGTAAVIAGAIAIAAATELAMITAGIALAAPMQHGGIVTGPTMALLGERGPEAVIPLDRFPSMMDERPLVIHTHVHVDGREIGVAAANYLPGVVRLRARLRTA